MLNLVFHHDGKTYTQISKREALKRFIDGDHICISPAKMRPCGAWFNMGMEICKHDLDDPSPDEDFYTFFDVLCDSFTHYNCTSETGRYIRYYLISEDSGLKKEA